jgi:glycosyltransferase involved in cell wall biosynthesis
MWLFVGTAIAALSVVPALGDALARLLGLENRLFAVLVTGVIALTFFAVRTRTRLEELNLRFGEMVRNTAIAEFTERYSQFDHRPSIAVVVAAFNEEEAIGGVLGDIPAEVEGYRTEPIVVVDGGEDDTAGVVRRAGFLVATHPVNRGQGDALRTGFRIALARGADIVVTMDADGQHRPGQLSDLVKPVIVGEADYVQGSRFLGEYDDAGSARHLGIRFFTGLINLLSGAGITDATNGFRAIRAEKLATLRLEEDRFSAPEIIMESARRGLRIAEIPIHIRTRSHGTSKKPRRFGYPLGFLRVTLGVWLRG